MLSGPSSDRSVVKKVDKADVMRDWGAWNGGAIEGIMNGVRRRILGDGRFPWGDV